MKKFIEKYVKPYKKEIIIGGSIIAAFGGVAAACIVYGYSKKPADAVKVVPEVPVSE